MGLIITKTSIWVCPDDEDAVEYEQSSVPDCILRTVSDDDGAVKGSSCPGCFPDDFLQFIMEEVADLL